VTAGATATNLRAGQMDRFALPLVLCILSLFVAYVSKPRMFLAPRK
jgi:hypothetical protein